MGAVRKLYSELISMAESDLKAEKSFSSFFDKFLVKYWDDVEIRRLARRIYEQAQANIKMLEREIRRYRDKLQEEVEDESSGS